MAKLVVEEQKEYPTLPADSIVHLKVEDVEMRTVQGNRGPWDKLEFKFKVLGIQALPAGGGVPANYENLIGENIYGSTSTKLTDSQENKLRLWSEAILNRPLELGFELDTDYFLGREVRGVTSTYDKRAINPATQKPFVGHQVASLLPMGAGGGGVVPGGQPQPQQAPPSAWGTPGVQQQPQAPQQDPWAGAPAPAANDPWSTAPQAPAPQQQAPQAPQPAAPAQQAPAPQAPPAQPSYTGYSGQPDPEDPGF